MQKTFKSIYSSINCNLIMNKKIKNIFLNSPFKSVKHSSYFYAYEELFSDFVDKKLTFVEVGILNGGSLFIKYLFFFCQIFIYKMMHFKIKEFFNHILQKW